MPSASPWPLLPAVEEASNAMALDGIMFEGGPVRWGQAGACGLDRLLTELWAACCLLRSSRLHLVPACFQQTRPCTPCRHAFPAGAHPAPR